MIHRYDVAVSETTVANYTRQQSVRGAVEHTARAQMHRGMTHHRLRSIFELWELPTKGWRIQDAPPDLFRLSGATPLYRESIRLECESIDGSVGHTTGVTVTAGYAVTENEHIIDVRHPEASFRLRCPRPTMSPVKGG